MARKIIFLAFGGLLAVIGLGLLTGGGIVFAVSDDHGYLTTGQHPYATSTRALVSDKAQLTSDVHRYDTWGTFRFRVRGEAGTAVPVFVGIGPALAVDRYLTGVATDRVTDLNFHPYRLTTARREGAAVPGPPAGQSFWVAKTAGRGPLSLDWRLATGEYELVMMNADGTPAVHVDAAVAVQIPHMRAIALGLVIGGAALLLVGVALLVAGIRTRRTKPPGAWPSPPPGAPSFTEP